MILGIDPGERRVGVAIADPGARVAVVLEVIDASEIDPVTRLAEIVDEREVEKVVVGRPIGLGGKPGPAVDAQQEFLARLRAALDVEVVEYDERLTTVIAEQGLRAGGASASARKRLRDAVAAQIMLQEYIDRRGASE